MKRWLLLAVAVFIAWVGSLDVPYHFDDSHSVEGNAAIRTLSNIPSFWTDPRTSTSIAENRVYRPLLYTFYSICWWIGGGSTWPFHAMKLLMHFLTSMAVFLIWARLFALPAWMPRGWKIRFPLTSKEHPITPSNLALFAALVFAIHPALSECVVYISSTTAMQAAMFMAWGFYFHLRSREGVKWLVWWLVWALIFYFLAVASKEIGITLVALVGWYELYTAKSDRIRTTLKTALQGTWPYLILAVLLLVWFLSMRPVEGDASRGGLSSSLYFVSQWRAWLYYFRVWFWPFGLNADHAGDLFAKTLTDSFVIQALIGNLVLFVFAFLKRKEFPAFLFGLIWFYVAISPDSSVVVLGEAIAERRMYGGAIGLAGGTLPPLLAFLTWAFSHPIRFSSRLGWGASTALLGLLIGAHARVEVWSTSENLWKDTLEKTPQSGRAMNNLALVYMGRGDFKQALELLERCERGDWSNWPNCPLNRGITLSHMGRIEEAKIAFQRALSLDPRGSAEHFFYASFCENHLKDYKQALEHYLISDQVTGSVYTAAKINAARMRMLLGEWREAKKLLTDTLAFEPGSSLAQQLLEEVTKKNGS